MKKTTTINHEEAAKAKGRKVSAIIHIAFLALLAFPFLQIVGPEDVEDAQIVMDFSSGSSAEGAKASIAAQTSSSESYGVGSNPNQPKVIETHPSKKSKPIEATIQEETVHIEETKEEAEEIKEPQIAATEEIESATIDNPEPAAESGMGAGKNGKGDAAKGSAASGNGRGYIEGDGALTRAVIDRGDTKKLAQENGTLILKICINRRGIVTFAEWDKEASTIKDTDIARTALDNVLKYRFETDRSAPSKECGRLTYIIDIN